MLFVLFCVCFGGQACMSSSRQPWIGRYSRCCFKDLVLENSEAATEGFAMCVEYCEEACGGQNEDGV